jgi:mannose-1-phosphate guanylyltransferase
MRIADRSLYEAPIVITNEEFRFLAAEQAREVGVELASILLEPQPRSTAPAVAAAAAFTVHHFCDDAVVQVLPSDHQIVEGDRYTDAVTAAYETALDDALVTFGIDPTEPSTGYGYIEIGEQLPHGARKVKRFVEKPTLTEAEQMIAGGNFAWNSGIFMFKATQVLHELALHAPEVELAATAAVAKAAYDLNFIRLDADSFAQSPNISLDYALMEKTATAAVVPASFIWSDMGSWDAVWKTGSRDEAGNLVSGSATLIGTRNSLVISHHGHLAVQGLEGVAIIASEDAVYVGRLEDSQNVGNIVKKLAAAKATEALTQTHPTSYRPWGGYTSIFNGDRFQVKRLFVKPGKKLSLQKHYHRSEHWTCVKGAAEVTIGEEVRTLRENESVYIPQGEVHRLANPGKILLEMIEVQTGSYLGEDDIVRIVDEFGRA